jgi:hypothetical protein
MTRLVPGIAKCVLLGVFLLGGFVSANASLITFKYSGAVIGTTTGGGPLLPLLPIGTPFSVSYTFDDLVQNPTGTSQFLTYRDIFVPPAQTQLLIVSSTVTLGTHTFTQLVAPAFPSAFGTNIFVSQAGSIPSAYGAGVSGFAMSGALSSEWEANEWNIFMNFPQRHFPSLALPLTQPDLGNAVPLTAVGFVQFLKTGDPTDGQAVIVLLGQPVPLPPAVVLFGAGLVALISLGAGRWWQKKSALA